MSKPEGTHRVHNVPPQYPFWPIALLHLLALIFGIGFEIVF